MGSLFDVPGEECPTAGNRLGPFQAVVRFVKLCEADVGRGTPTSGVISEQ